MKRFELLAKRRVAEVSPAHPSGKGLVRRHPAAAKLHRAMAMRIVCAGKSKYYDFALEHLRTAKRLYDKLGVTEEWQEVIAIVRRDHSRKQGFMSSFEQIAAGGAPTRSKSFTELARKRWKKQTSK